MDYNGDECEYVTLLRQNSSQPWGFRMMGGQDQGCSLYIAKVAPRSLAERYGLRAGDGLVRIGQVPATHLSHDHAKAEILRGGNDLHLVVKRGTARAMEEPKVPDRSEVVEEQTQYRGDRNPSSQSRSFRIITDSLVEEMNSFPGAHGDSSTANANPFG